MTESSYNNSLAYRHILPTIKTLPATLPEPRSVVRGPSFEAQGPWSTDHGPAARDRGPGLLRSFLNQLWTLLKGVAPQSVGACAFDPGALMGW